MLEVEVEDSGIGIDEGVKTNMFQIFANEKENKKSLKVSSGLGLHVANLIAKSMGGSIAFNSSKHKGTIAIVAVKVFMATPKCESEKTDSTSQNVFANELCKINKYVDKVLVVDDNMSNVYVLKKMLKSIGIESDEAHNGSEAVDKFRKSPYKLIFMDVNMPVMNGLDASSQISKEKIPTVIVALTAQDEINETDYRLYGIHKWVVKPISLLTIKEIIGQLK
jgi:CheY-like chemotaxis protein